MKETETNDDEEHALSDEQSPTSPPQLTEENAEERKNPYSIPDIHNTTQLYYVLSSSRITGPYTIDGIVSQYTYGQLLDSSGSTFNSPDFYG